MTGAAPDDVKWGHIRLSRKMVAGDDPLWESARPFDWRSAWVDLIYFARFAPGVAEGEYLERGEFVASVRFLARRWRWGTGTVHAFLERLKKLERLVERRAGQRGTVYALVNYGKWNPEGVERRTRTRTPNRTKAEHCPNKDKKEEEGLEKGENAPALVGSWPAEVSRVFTKLVGQCGPGEAGAAISPVFADFSGEEVVRGADYYCRHSTDKPQFLNVRTFAKQLPQWVKRSAPISLLDESGNVSAEFRAAVGGQK